MMLQTPPQRKSSRDGVSAASVTTRASLSSNSHPAPDHAPIGQSDHLGMGRRQPLTIVMLTPRISPLELICTVCFLPLVLTRRLAANPAASTKTSIRPPPAVPCRFPNTLRLASLQLPEIRSPWLVTSLDRSNL